jgi:hypothetical protein
LSAIQPSDQKLWTFQTGTLVPSDVTSASPSRDSTSTPRKTASGNYCKNLSAIQRSDQKLWPFQAGTLVSSDETYASPSSDCTSTTRKTASRNTCKNLSAIQRSDQKLWPFEPVLWSRAHRPSSHRVAIPQLLQEKQLPETTVKI